MTLRLLDTFSGIGGFSLAARWLGSYQTVQFVERDPYCQRILRKHRSTMTSAPSTPPQDQLTLFAGGFPAKTSRSRGNVLVLDWGPVPACSTSCSEWFAKWAPDTSSWRTSQASVLTGWEPFSDSWPTMGVLANGHAYQLPILELGTFAIVGGLFPTPTATEWKGAPKNRFIGSPHWRGVRTSESLRRCETDPPLVHPSYAEALMGYPPEWTASGP
jgi:DNA (cytosine-5)-methyltransferase 1